MDLVLKLREIRRMRGMSQKDVARRSGVGLKTISSFETGERIASLKLDQLTKLLKAYGLTEAEFFSEEIEKQIAPWDYDEDRAAASSLLDELSTLPTPVRRNLVENFRRMVETITNVQGREGSDDREG